MFGHALYITECHTYATLDCCDHCTTIEDIANPQTKLMMHVASQGLHDCNPAAMLDIDSNHPVESSSSRLHML